MMDWNIRDSEGRKSRTEAITVFQVRGGGWCWKTVRCGAAPAAVAKQKGIGCERAWNDRSTYKRNDNVPMSLCGWLRGRGWQEKLEEGKKDARDDLAQTIWVEEYRHPTMFTPNVTNVSVLVRKEMCVAFCLFSAWKHKCIKLINTYHLWSTAVCQQWCRIENTKLFTYVFFPKKETNNQDTAIKDREILERSSQDN